MEGSCSSDELSKISLRPLGLSDIDDFMVWATDKKVTRFCTWEPYTSKEDGIKFIKEQGMITVEANSAMFWGSRYWGQGIGTRAVKMVADTIFKEWTHLERLEALVDVDNVASQRVLEKAGFQREGILRKYVVLKGRTCDRVMFSLLSTDHCLS
ncbi:hypothetical protein M0R45_020465 [Rubus argutus]|uniref:N-acetyltransferase domain-containing protein n=1 Tax=Rubus argutus TaxID=59490 RepID=A0AAW1XA94_RUBAR